MVKVSSSLRSRAIKMLYSVDKIDEDLTTIAPDRGKKAAAWWPGAFFELAFPVTIACLGRGPRTRLGTWLYSRDFELAFARRRLNDSEDRIMTVKTSFKGSFTALVTPF